MRWASQGPDAAGKREESTIKTASKPLRRDQKSCKKQGKQQLAYRDGNVESLRTSLRTMSCTKHVDDRRGMHNGVGEVEEDGWKLNVGR